MLKGQGHTEGDRNKTAETTITKLATGRDHH